MKLWTAIDRFIKWVMRPKVRAHPAFCCQKCGEPIGYLGRCVEFTMPFIRHDCRK